MKIEFPIECFDRTMVIEAADGQDADAIEQNAWNHYYEWFKDENRFECCEEYIADQLRADGFDIIDFETEEKKTMNNVYTYNEIEFLREGYKKETKEEAELILAVKLRAVVEKELKQFRRCDVCNKVYRLDPKDKKDFFCSAECAKRANRQPDLPFEGENYEIEES